MPACPAEPVGVELTAVQTGRPHFLTRLVDRLRDPQGDACLDLLDRALLGWPARGWQNLRMAGLDLVSVLRYRMAVTYGFHALLGALGRHETATRYEVRFGENVEETANLPCGTTPAACGRWPRRRRSPTGSRCGCRRPTSARSSRTHRALHVHDVGLLDLARLVTTPRSDVTRADLATVGTLAAGRLSAENQLTVDLLHAFLTHETVTR